MQDRLVAYARCLREIGIIDCWGEGVALSGAERAGGGAELGGAVEGGGGESHGCVEGGGEVDGAGWVAVLRRTALGCLGGCDEACSVGGRGRGALSVCVVVRCAGVEGWRCSGETVGCAGCLPGLGAGEEVCHEARHFGYRAEGWQRVFVGEMGDGEVVGLGVGYLFGAEKVVPCWQARLCK